MIRVAGRVGKPNVRSLETSSLKVSLGRNMPKTLSQVLVDFVYSISMSQKHNHLQLHAAPQCGLKWHTISKAE